MRVRVLCTSVFVALILSVSILIPKISFADSYDVTAKVSAPLPPDVPLLLTPENNSVIAVASNTVLITGKCPAVIPPLIAVLIRTDTTIGTGSCDSLGIFRVAITLVLGVNVIRAKFINITGDSTIIGDLITLTYNPPAATANNNPPVTNATSSALKLVFDPDTVVIKTKETTTIQFTISGGTAPYAVTIDWGDGTTQLLHYDVAGGKALGHIYTTIQSRPVRIRISIKDASGASLKQERAVVSFERPTVPSSQPNNSLFRSKLMFFWGGAVVALLAILFAMHSAGYAGLAHVVEHRLKKPKKKAKK